MKVLKINVENSGAAVGKVLLIIDPVFLYNIPNKSNDDNFHRASGWNISAPDWRGKLLVNQSGAAGDSCQVQFTNTDGVLFGVAVITKSDFNSSRAFKKVRDSSRYCTQQIQNIVSGDSAVYGIGFLKSEHISQLIHCMQEYFGLGSQKDSLVRVKASIKCTEHAQVKKDETDGLIENLKYAHHDKAQVDTKYERVTTPMDTKHTGEAPVKVKVEEQDKAEHARTDVEVGEETSHAPTNVKVGDGAAHAPLIKDETARAQINVKIEDETSLDLISVKVENETAHVPTNLKIEEETAHAPTNVAVGDGKPHAPNNVEVGDETAHAPVKANAEIANSTSNFVTQAQDRASRDANSDMNSNINNIASTETEGSTGMSLRNRDTRGITCPICPEPLIFPPENKLKFLFHHLAAVHNLSKLHTCRLCSIIFSTPDLRLRHVKGVHKVCPVCPKEFVKEISLQKHLKLAHDFTSTTLTPSVAPVENVKFINLTCSICLKKFGKNQYLNRHLKQFHNSNSISSVLAENRRKRENFIRKCKICSKTFRKGKHLKRHYKHTHSLNSDLTPATSSVQEIPPKKAKVTYGCSICLIEFEHGKDLSDHGKQVHNPESI